MANDGCVPIAEAQVTSFSVSFGENRRPDSVDQGRLSARNGPPVEWKRETIFGQHFEEAFDAQVGTHRVHVVDAIDGAAHVFDHGGEELYLGAPGAVFK